MSKKELIVTRSYKKVYRDGDRIVKVFTPEQAKKYSQTADGVIVGSAIVKIVAKYGKEAPEKVYDYVKSMKDAIR